MSSPSNDSPDLVAGPLSERPYPMLAKALRANITNILAEWEMMVRRNILPARDMTFDQLRDSVPEILNQMADALASGGHEDVRKLMDRSPSQRIQRFQLHYDTWDLATEDRMLRWIIVDHVGKHLARRLTLEEDAALHWSIDLMAQQAMVHFVNHQNAKLRNTAEAELRYLSFLSHDLNGNLNSVTVWLQDLKSQLIMHPQFAEEVESLDTAQKAILDTVAGMGRMLQAERLRHSKTLGVPNVSVGLHALCKEVAAPFVRQAEQKGLTIEIKVPSEPGTSQGDLIRLILQNLLGNAVKYSKTGTITISAEADQTGKCWTLAVSDQGPGIAPEHVDRIFEAFQRGEMHGQNGVGLGLAIASRAAKLIEAELTVESHLGSGATFRLVLPVGLIVTQNSPS